MDWNTLKAALAPATVTVKVELPYGRDVDVTVGTLSFGEWMQAETLVSEPPVPRTLAGPNNTKLPNRDDVAYRTALAKANEDRAYIRLALALEKGGTALPGATIADKAAALKTDLDAGIANALMTFIASAALGGKAAADATADSF